QAGNSQSGGSHQVPGEAPSRFLSITTEFLNCLTHNLPADVAFFTCEADQECPMTQHIDEPGDTVRKAISKAEGGGCEGYRLAHRCRQAEAMAHVSSSFLGAQGSEMPAQRHPLIELREFWPGEYGAQLRLPHQNDLQEFHALGFQVRQQPQLFQHTRFKG